ncbi:protein-disulfide reductase DsbD domain-containing protein [Pelagibacterium xiamenense]|uniref:protein-disulfide reductase DsbD domain-containing protein n=1 Tax=Pelagibacterium xiamenense TaxID=2901140 RepID=UPI001E635E04|nr:protein-disulfide reductase DsbD domain-containing protein [Pelagibacterium xiamenense]MCD7059252.1 hypothetical protein [Pelagibacterium xiamenense]
MKIPTVILLLFAVASGAHAGETAWQQVDENARLRLVFSDTREPDGSTWAAIEIDMPSNTKTYWRVPGETGIPLQLDVGGSDGIDGFDIVWPFPVRETDKGYLDHVYYGHVVLPVRLQATSDTPFLEIEMTLGVCSDVCVPVVAGFSHQLSFRRADAGHALRIRQALAEAPLPYPGELEPFGEAHFDPQTRRLAVALAAPDFPHETTIADIRGELTLLGPGEPSGDGAHLLFPVFANGGAPELAGKSVTLTFMTPDGPYELTRQIGTP